MLIDGLTRDWKSYGTTIETHPAMILVDVSLSAGVPHAEAPVLHWVMLRMLDPGPDGTGTPEEAEACLRFEAYVAQAALRYEVIFAGRTRWNGFWRMSFYGDYGSSLNQLVDAMSELTGGRLYKVSTYDDPAWLHHSCELAPDRDAERWMKNFDICKALQESGDCSEISRIVDHFVAFDDEFRLDQFVLSAVADGFVEAGRQCDDGRWLVRLQRSDRVQMDHIHQVVTELITSVERAGGAYDGWGCEVLSAPDESDDQSHSGTAAGSDASVDGMGLPTAGPTAAIPAH